MKRIGSVSGAAQGIAVVRSESEAYPDLGTDLIDEQLDEVGTVVDVFGPVERPYLAVSTSVEPIASLVGTMVYARD
jgi:RNA-binding protein